MPNKDLIKARKQFVGQKRKASRSNENVAAAKMALGQPSKKGPSDAASRKAFFIKTRAQELKAAGKKVDRSKLAARYETGKVKREEFYAGGAKEKSKRIAAAQPKPKPKVVAKDNKGYAAAAYTALGQPASKKSLTTTKMVKDSKGYSSAAAMALGQPYGKKSLTTTTPKKSSASKGSGSIRRYER